VPESRSFDLVIVGLGNPGKDYTHTRHNIGERVVRRLAESLGVKLLEERRFRAEVAKGVIYRTRPKTLNLDISETKLNRSEAFRTKRPAPGGLGDEEDRFSKVAACPNPKPLVESGMDDRRVALLFPTTYMNLSGESLKAFVDYYKMHPSEVVIVCDDVDLPFGFLRLRKEGSAGGHNGLKSIERSLGTREYPRLKIGVGAKREQQDLADHVLSRFTSEEAASLPEVIENAVDILKRLASEEIDKVMNCINQKVRTFEKEGEENCRESKETKPL